MFCCLQATAEGSAAQQSGKKSGQQDKTKQEKVKKRLQELEGALIGGEKAGMADCCLWKVAIQSSSLGSRLTSLFFFFFLTGHTLIFAAGPVSKEHIIVLLVNDIRETCLFVC